MESCRDRAVREVLIGQLLQTGCFPEVGDVKIMHDSPPELGLTARCDPELVLDPDVHPGHFRESLGYAICPDCFADKIEAAGKIMVEFGHKEQKLQTAEQLACESADFIKMAITGATERISGLIGHTPRETELLVELMSRNLLLVQGFFNLFMQLMNVDREKSICVWIGFWGTAFGKKLLGLWRKQATSL